MNEESQAKKDLKPSPQKGAPRKDIKRKRPVLFEDADLDRTKEETKKETDKAESPTADSGLKSFEAVSIMPLRDRPDYDEVYEVKIGESTRKIFHKRLIK